MDTPAEIEDLITDVETGDTLETEGSSVQRKFFFTCNHTYLSGGKPCYRKHTFPLDAIVEVMWALEPDNPGEPVRDVVILKGDRRLTITVPAEREAFEETLL